MPGPPKKPTRLRVIEGNPGKLPINKNEPKPRSTTRIRVPANLSKEAKKEYRRIAKLLIPIGLLTDIDHRALELYAETYATWIHAMSKVQSSGLVVKFPSGFPGQNPYLSIANQASKRMQSLLCEFGMTPAARARVTAAVDGKNEFDDL